MIVGYLIIGLFCLSMFVLYNLLYNENIKKTLVDLNEYSIYMKRLDENKTKFLKRIGDSVYIEYGIEKHMIITLFPNRFKSIFCLKDDKTNTHTDQRYNFIFNYINKLMLSKTFTKYNDKIFNTKEYGVSIVDKQTYDLMEYMVKLTRESMLKHENDIDNTPNGSNIKHFDIDDILDRINKVGYDELSDDEKDFLRKQK